MKQSVPCYDRTRRTFNRHPFSERKRVVELYESGYGSKRIGCALGVDDSMVRSWLRKYRKHGLESLQPYWRDKGEERKEGKSNRMRNAERFREAYEAYGSTLATMASIARQYGLKYSSFHYYLVRYHPELVARRKARGHSGVDKEENKKKP